MCIIAFFVISECILKVFIVFFIESGVEHAPSGSELVYTMLYKVLYKQLIIGFVKCCLQVLIQIPVFYSEERRGGLRSGKASGFDPVLPPLFRRHVPHSTIPLCIPGIIVDSGI